MVGPHTCARLAAAMGSGLNSLNSSSMGAPSSCSTTMRASRVEKGSICGEGERGERVVSFGVVSCCVCETRQSKARQLAMLLWG